MPARKKLLILAGDGIGPEVMAQVRRVIAWFDRFRVVSFGVVEGLVGGASFDAHGTPLTEETLADAKAADAVLLGAVGGPKWDGLPFESKPERGLLRLRKEMALFANLRPAIVFEAMAEAAALRLARGVNWDQAGTPAPADGAAWTGALCCPTTPTGLACSGPLARPVPNG